MNRLIFVRRFRGGEPADQSRRHSLSLVTASGRNNLYWQLGQFSETRLHHAEPVPPFYDQCDEHRCVDTFRPIAHTRPAQDFGDFDGFVSSFLYGGSNPDSVRSAVTSAFQQRRDSAPGVELASAAVRGLAVTNITDAANTRPMPGHLQTARLPMTCSPSAGGGIENSPVDPTLRRSSSSANIWNASTCTRASA